MRTALVTGGAGFLGSHLVDELLEGGATVRVLDNLSTGSLVNLRSAAERHSRVGGESGGTSNGSRLEVVIGDVRDREVLRKALRNVTHVFHFAALPARAVSIADPREIHSVNVDGTLNVLQGAVTEGVWRVVLGSCACVYGIPSTVPVEENAPLEPGSLFAASKVAAETYGRAFYVRHHLDTVVLRYFSAYGPRQRATADGALVPQLIEAVRRQHPFFGGADRSLGDLTYIGDVVAATLSAARAPRAAGRAINIGSGYVVDVWEVRSIVSKVLGIPVVAGPPQDEEPGSRPMCASTVLAAELLEFSPRVSLSAGLARVIRSLTEEEGMDHPTLARVGLDD